MSLFKGSFHPASGHSVVWAAGRGNRRARPARTRGLAHSRRDSCHQGSPRAFLRSSGFMDEILVHASWEPREWELTLRLRRASCLIEGELNRALCDALIDLGAPSVVVISEGMRKGDLKSIPEVKEAILEAWLSERNLERQLRAAASGEDIPTWPVLVQREFRPQYTDWSITGGAESPWAVGAEDLLPGAGVASPRKRPLYWG